MAVKSHLPTISLADYVRLFLPPQSSFLFCFWRILLKLVCVSNSVLFCFLLGASAASRPVGESRAQSQSSRHSCHHGCIMSSINNKEIAVVMSFVSFLCDHFGFEGLGVDWSLGSLTTSFFSRITALIYRCWQNTSGRVSSFFLFFRAGQFFEVLHIGIS